MRPDRPKPRGDRRSAGPRPGSRPADRPGTDRVAKAAPKTDWQPVADWYDGLVGADGSEYHQKVVLPGVLRLLAAKAGDRVLDVACGQGVLCRMLAAAGVKTTGIDAAPDLITAARERSPVELPHELRPDYHVGDAREIERLGPAAFDAAACVLAIQNIHPIDPVFRGVATTLKPLGKFVVVMMHPAFRSPEATAWGWDGVGGVQYRRVDRYLDFRKHPITTHPGKKDGAYTWTFHKPIGAFVRSLRAAGLLVDALEEWPSHKTSQPGPRAAAENRARSEIPLFLAIRALRVELGASDH